MLEIENTKEISIPQKTKANVSTILLRDTEQSILNYMLLSTPNFIKIKNILLENDFTFLIHKVIYKYMLILEEMFLKDGVNDLSTKLEIFADILDEKQNIKRTSILDILSQTPSLYIDSDLEIIDINAMEKDTAIYSRGIKRSVTIENKYGVTWCDFIDDRLISVGTTNIASLPMEVHDNFADTLGSLTNLDLKSGDNEASMTLYESSNHEDSIESFYLKKDVIELKWFDDICKWADQYNLDEDTFPRDRLRLEDLVKLDISGKGISELPKEIGKLKNLKVLLMDENNIKELPSELYHLRNLVLLSCMKNEISYLSEDIVNLQGLLMIAACHNNISFLPNNFFKLKSLTSFCFHGNKLTVLSSDIGYLSNLTSMTISNNDIASLPESLSKLENLDSLDIENTQILDIPINFLQHRSLNNLSINDDLLPFVAQNMQYLNIDTINLTASHIEVSSKIVQELNFKLDKESWVEDRDKKGNGCIKLSKYEEE